MNNAEADDMTHQPFSGRSLNASPEEENGKWAALPVQLGGLGIGAQSRTVGCAVARRSGWFGGNACCPPPVFHNRGQVATTFSANLLQQPNPHATYQLH